MKKLVATTLVLGFMVLGGANAWAFGPHPYGGTLNPEQRAELQKVWGQFMTQTQDERTQVSTKVEQLKTLYAQPTPDKNKIAALQNEIIDLRATMAKRAVALQATLDGDVYFPAGMMGMHMLNGWHNGNGSQFDNMPCYGPDQPRGGHRGGYRR